MMAISNWTTQIDDFFFTLDHNKHWKIPETDAACPSKQEQEAQQEYWITLQQKYRTERTEKRLENWNKKAKSFSSLSALASKVCGVNFTERFGRPAPGERHTPDY